MHPVSMTNVYMASAVAKYFLLLNSHAWFQNIYAEEISYIEKFMTQYV